MRLMILMFILVSILVSAETAQAGAIGPARIRLIEGDISFQTPDVADWLPASVNTPLDEGDAVWCPEGSRVEIQLPDGSLVRLDGDSLMDVLAIEEGFVHLHLARGRMFLRTAASSKDQGLQIDADDTTVLPTGRTRLRLDMLANSEEDVSIFKGSAYVEGNGNRTKVRSGELLSLEDGHSELLPLNPPDAWERWNSDRDRDLAKNVRTESHLPDELAAYSYELDANGSWVNVPEYGMVWRPTVVYSDDWAPYRSGRWIWKGDDYVWVSYDSWGWAPYHYGRWVVITGRGWCWVPPSRGDIYWGPGYVGWYRTGENIGWTPLAPGETYYGRRNYGRNSVTITNENVRITNIRYRNERAPGGVTITSHNDFLKGRTVPQHLVGATTPPTISAVAGSPHIKPLPETRMPIIKNTPIRNAAPRTERQDSRRLQTRFPRVSPVVPASGAPKSSPPVKSIPPPVTPSALPEKKMPNPVTQPVIRSTPPQSVQPSSPAPVTTPRPQEPSKEKPHDRQTSESATKPGIGTQAERPVSQSPRGNTEQKSISPSERKSWRVTTPGRYKDER